MYDAPISIGKILTRLAAQSKAIAVATEGVPSERLRRRPSPGEWSANEVLAHLRACGDMWGGYIVRILDEDHPTFRAMNPRRWIERTDYRELDFHRSRRAFATQRTALLGRLRSLAPDDWSRSAAVTGAGHARERTVYQYADWLANHERSHIKQMEALGARASAVRDRSA